MSRVLLLNADHRPIKTIGWQRAVSLLVQDRVDLVLADPARQVRSPTTSLDWPSVVALRRYVRVRQVPALTRRHLLARDRHSCVYCGVTAGSVAAHHPSDRLTVDHVVPRSRGDYGFVRLPWSGARVPVQSWENVVIACGPCNRRKGARTPDEAGMALRWLPYRPTRQELLGPVVGMEVPEAWAPWLEAA